MSNNLQVPFQDIVGENSPVQQALKYIRILADEKPMPSANTDQSRSVSALILTHILGLCDSAGLINYCGYHSAAITMFRPIEDATDCSDTVALDSNAARNWAEGNLMSSDAVKIWTNAVNLTLSDSRMGRWLILLKNLTLKTKTAFIFSKLVCQRLYGEK